MLRRAFEARRQLIIAANCSFADAERTFGKLALNTYLDACRYRRRRKELLITSKETGRHEHEHEHGTNRHSLHRHHFRIKAVSLSWSGWTEVRVSVSESVRSISAAEALIRHSVEPVC